MTPEHWDGCDGAHCLGCDVDRHGEESVGVGCPGCREECVKHGRPLTLTAEAEVMLRVAQVLDALPDDETRLRVLAQAAARCRLYRQARQCLMLAEQQAEGK